MVKQNFLTKMLLLCALIVGSMTGWGQTTLYSWNGNGSTTTANETGGSATAVQTSGSNIQVGVSQKGNYCLKMNKGFSNGAYYINIALNEALSTGDKVTIGAFRTSSTTAVLGVDYGTTDTQQLNSNTSVLESNGTPGDWELTVPAAANGSKVIRLYRNSGSTGMWVSKVVVTRASSGPSISASNLNIAYNAEEGEIEYTINNGVDGGVLSASTEDDWIILDDVKASTVPFICDANSETTARTATVTLTYTYNNTETVTKDVTITQAAAPAIYSTIPALFAAATSTETSVFVTFNNWVVSGVSTTGKNVFVTDNNGNGFMIYSSSDQSSTYSVGDILSGTAVPCTLLKYGGYAEIMNLNASNLTKTSGGTVSVSNIAMADLSGVNTGAFVSYNGLTCSISNSKYYLSDGTTTIQLHNSLYDFGALEAGHKYNITGIYQQYNDTKEILPRSAADIEEVVVPVITADNVNIAYDATGGSITFTIDNPVEGGTITASTENSWITLGNETASPISFTCAANEGAARSATVRLTYTYNTSETVTKDVTITQAKAPAQVVDGVFDFTYEDEIDYGTNLQPSTEDIKEAVTFKAGNVTLTPEPTVNNKYWRWYIAAGSNPPTLRLYTDTKMTIAVPEGYVITKIDFVGTQNLEKVSVSAGNYEAVGNNSKSATWIGCAQSVVFTRNGSNPFFTNVTVTYSLMPASATVNIPDSHYGTYCSEYSLNFSNTGIEAYTAAYDGTIGKVVLTKIADGIVPANTGVVLYSETTGEQDIPTTTTTNTIDVDNEMVGVTVQTPVAYHPDSKYNYILQEGKFKKATGASLRANRAYLSTTYNVSPSGAPELDLVFGDETTGIQNIERTINDNQYYTLDGRRVAEPTKGLYIVNGKKVVIK